MVRVYVNDVPVDVDEGSTVITAVRKAGFKVPTLCRLGDIYREASCRLCLVELSTSKLVPACAYPVSEGLKVYTDTHRVRRVRRIVIELILASHRIRCWYCMRKGGDCILLELAKEYGVEGIPVCAECKLYGEECLLTKGYICLGPLTVAGCSSPCTAQGAPCIGCRGPITRRDVIEEAAKFYIENGVDINRLLSIMKLFWSAVPELSKVVDIIKDVYKVMVR